MNAALLAILVAVPLAGQRHKPVVQPHRTAPGWHAPMSHMTIEGAWKSWVIGDRVYTDKQLLGERV